MIKISLKVRTNGNLTKKILLQNYLCLVKNLSGSFFFFWEGEAWYSSLSFNLAFLCSSICLRKSSAYFFFRSSGVVPVPPTAGNGNDCITKLRVLNLLDPHSEPSLGGNTINWMLNFMTFDTGYRFNVELTNRRHQFRMICNSLTIV